MIRRTHPLSSGIKKFSVKLAPKYEGPLKIVEIKSLTVYVLENVNRDTAYYEGACIVTKVIYPHRAVKNIL